jgi:hypothetical protein
MVFSEEENEPEAIKDIMRQSKTILTEENLRKYLTDETTTLNLEHHYWISNSVISKLSLLVPNLQELSLRRMPQITNMVFARMFEDKWS